MTTKKKIKREDKERETISKKVRYLLTRVVEYRHRRHSRHDRSSHGRNERHQISYNSVFTRHAPSVEEVVATLADVSIGAGSSDDDDAMVSVVVFCRLLGGVDVIVEEICFGFLQHYREMTARKQQKEME